MRGMAFSLHSRTHADPSATLSSSQSQGAGRMGNSRVGCIERVLGDWGFRGKLTLLTPFGQPAEVEASSGISAANMEGGQYFEHAENWSCQRRVQSRSGNAGDFQRLQV